MAIDTDKLEAVAWMVETRDERWLAFEHEDPDAIAIPFTETPLCRLTDLNRANEIIAEKEAEIARLKKSMAYAAMYLKTGFIECSRCGHEVKTKHTDAEYELRATLKEPRT